MVEEKRIEQAVFESIIEYLDVCKRDGLLEISEEDLKSLTYETNLKDIGVDSMGYLEITLIIEDKLGIKFEDLSELSGVETVKDLIEFVKGWV